MAQKKPAAKAATKIAVPSTKPKINKPPRELVIGDRVNYHTMKQSGIGKIHDIRENKGRWFDVKTVDGILLTLRPKCVTLYKKPKPAA